MSPGLGQLLRSCTCRGSVSFTPAADGPATASIVCSVPVADFVIRELPELRSHRRQPAFEDTDDLAANIGRRDGSSIHEPTPTVDFILGADDHLIDIALYSDEALGLLDLPHKIIDGLGALSVDG